MTQRLAGGRQQQERIHSLLRTAAERAKHGAYGRESIALLQAKASGVDEPRLPSRKRAEHGEHGQQIGRLANIYGAPAKRRG